MAISSQQVIGTVGATTGDSWTANTFASDQYSNVQMSSTPLTGAQWVTRSGGLFRGLPGRWCCRTTAVMTSASAARHVHVQYSGAQRRGLQRDGEARRRRQVLFDVEWLGVGGLGQRHQCRGLLHD